MSKSIGTDHRNSEWRANGAILAGYLLLNASLCLVDSGLGQQSENKMLLPGTRMTSGRLAGCCRPRLAGTSGLPRGRAGTGAFSLIEVLIVMGLLMILIAAGMGAILSMDSCTRRAADYNAALAVVEAKIEDIRAATYNPPNSPWTSSTVYLTNNTSVALDQAGVTFKVAGTVISTITPVASGHLVTVTGTFREPRGALTISLQTLVNRYSAGQQ
jgi:type II secretory pathway pseudopilin PulG